MTYQPIENFNQANKELIDVSEQITQRTAFLDTLREEWLIAKANYENDKARFLLGAKLKNPEWTQSEIQAQAVQLSYQSRLDFIKAESSYKKCLNEIKALRDRLDVAKEISWNLRKDRVQV